MYFKNLFQLWFPWKLRRKQISKILNKQILILIFIKFYYIFIIKTNSTIKMETEVHFFFKIERPSIQESSFHRLPWHRLWIHLCLVCIQHQQDLEVERLEDHPLLILLNSEKLKGSDETEVLRKKSPYINRFGTTAANRYIFFIDNFSRTWSIDGITDIFASSEITFTASSKIEDVAQFTGPTSTFTRTINFSFRTWKLGNLWRIT